MRILLINPPNTYYKGSLELCGDLPLGLLYIASTVKTQHDVKILDCLLMQAKKENFTISEKKIIKKIKEYNPDIVGIAAPFTSQINNTLKAARVVKKVNKKIIVVVGGAHVSINHSIIKDKDVDYGIIGEGEYSFKALISKQSLEKIPGLIFKEKGRIKFNPPKPIDSLDDLQLPAYDLVDIEEYFRLQEKGISRVAGLIKQKREISMITSRGCPYNCIFCSIHLHMGRKWRAHSADYVLKHIKYLQERHNIEHIHFDDDNLTLDKRRFEKILDGLSKLDKKITWDTPNGIRVDSLNKNLLKKMKHSGLTNLKVGVESGDQNVLDNIIDKNLDLNKVVEIAKACKELKIPLSASFVIGFPGEKEENIKKTVDFSLMLLRKYDIYGSPYFATPLIGTRLYKICKKNNYFARKPSPKSYATSTLANEGGHGMIKTEDFTPELLAKYSAYYKRKEQEIIFLKKIKSLREIYKILTEKELLKERFKKFITLVGNTAGELAEKFRIG